MYSLSTVPNGWEEFFSHSPIQEILNTLNEEKRQLCPEPENVFNAFHMCSPDEIKCIIVGQDPYPTKGVAYGLSFSSKPNCPTPASLRNIFKKLQQEGYTTKTSCLEKWARQGVFLINTALTVPEKCAGAHTELWYNFTLNLFQYLSKKEGIVWILWGKKAQLFRGYVNEKCLLIEGGHPSPINMHGGFLDKDYFTPCNKFLEIQGKDVIDWNL